MNVSNVTTGVSQISEKIRFSYSIASINEIVKSITATVIQDELVIGFFNMSRNGVLGFTLEEDHNMSADDIKSTFIKLIDECYDKCKFSK